MGEEGSKEIAASKGEKTGDEREDKREGDEREKVGRESSERRGVGEGEEEVMGLGEEIREREEKREDKAKLEVEESSFFKASVIIGDGGRGRGGVRGIRRRGFRGEVRASKRREWSGGVTEGEEGEEGEKGGNEVEEEKDDTTPGEKLRERGEQFKRKETVERERERERERRKEERESTWRTWSKRLG